LEEAQQFGRDTTILEEAQQFWKRHSNFGRDTNILEEAQQFWKRHNRFGRGTTVLEEAQQFWITIARPKVALFSLSLKSVSKYAWRENIIGMVTLLCMSVFHVRRRASWQVF
jgi:hypothetical protein